LPFVIGMLRTESQTRMQVTGARREQRLSRTRKPASATFINVWKTPDLPQASAHFKGLMGVTSHGFGLPAATAAAACLASSELETLADIMLV